MRSLYEMPESEVLVVRIESGLLYNTNGFNGDNLETPGSGDPLDLGD